MTCEEKLNEIYEIYQKVLVLSDKNGCKILKLRNKQLGKDLVLHILPKANSVYETLCKFETENLPRIYDVFTLSDGMLVLEEYIDGINVAEILQTGKMKRQGAFKIVKTVCNALKVLHSNNIVHRDIKPENIMVTKNGRVVLIDFNVARKITVAKLDTEIMGTVGYAAPEQLGISQSDMRTDIYALGILLNVMLTAQHPSKQLAKGKAGKIVLKCTQINPDLRYQNVDQLIAEL